MGYFCRELWRESGNSVESSTEFHDLYSYYGVGTEEEDITNQTERYSALVSVLSEFVDKSVYLIFDKNRLKR